MNKHTKGEISNLVPEENIHQKILVIRGVKVMLDTDLAKLYQVATKYLNQQVRRNTDRFPEDFMFQLNQDEFDNLRLQFATSSLNYGGRRYMPYAFTEHGVAMLSSVLNSKRAIQMSIFIVRAFIKMRELLVNHQELAIKIEELERKQREQGDLLSSVHRVLQQLINPPERPPKKMGFNVGNI